MRASLLAEEKTVDRRLDERLRRADAIMAGETAAPKADIRQPKTKSKIVRDTFSIPIDEHATIEKLRARARQLGFTMTRSQVIRAGVCALSKFDDAALMAAASEAPPMELGRPRRVRNIS